MDPQLLTLSFIRTASAACALILSIFAFRAYRSTRGHSLLWLGRASALLAAGFVGAGVLYQVTGSLSHASILEAPFTLTALLLMIASLYAKNERVGRSRQHESPAK